MGSNAELARLAGVNDSTVSRWLAGRTATINAEVWERMWAAVRPALDTQYRYYPRSQLPAGVREAVPEYAAGTVVRVHTLRALAGVRDITELRLDGGVEGNRVSTLDRRVICAVRMDSADMLPVVAAGDVLLCSARGRSGPTPGAMVVVRVGDRAYVRRWRRVRDVVVLDAIADPSASMEVDALDVGWVLIVTEVRRVMQ